MNEDKKEVKKEKAIILIDEANYFYGFRKKNWKIDYKKFLDFLKNQYEILEAFYFTGIISKKAYFDSHLEYDPHKDLHKFLETKNKQNKRNKDLKESGYRVIDKPVASVYDSVNADYKRKCNFDVEITLKAVDLINNYDVLILCSGDGDFVKLIKYVKGKYKKTLVIGHKDRFNWELEKAANRTIFLEDVQDKIE